MLARRSCRSFSKAYLVLSVITTRRSKAVLRIIGQGDRVRSILQSPRD